MSNTNNAVKAKIVSVETRNGVKNGKEWEMTVVKILLGEGVYQLDCYDIKNNPEILAELEKRHLNDETSVIFLEIKDITADNYKNITIKAKLVEYNGKKVEKQATQSQATAQNKDAPKNNVAQPAL